MGKSKTKTKDDCTNAISAQPVKLKKQKVKKQKKKTKPESQPAEENGGDALGCEIVAVTETPLQRVDGEVVANGDGGGGDGGARKKKKKGKEKKSKTDKSVEKVAGDSAEIGHGDAEATREPTGGDASKTKSSKKKKGSKRKSLDGTTADAKVIAEDVEAAGQDDDKVEKKNEYQKQEPPSGVGQEGSPPNPGSGKKKTQSKKKTRGKSGDGADGVGDGQVNGQVVGTDANSTEAAEIGAKKSSKPKKKKAKRKPEAEAGVPDAAENGTSEDAQVGMAGGSKAKDGSKKTKPMRNSEAGLETLNSVAASAAENGNSECDGAKDGDGCQGEGGGKKMKPKKKSKKNPEAGRQTPDKTANGPDKSDGGEAADDKSAEKLKKKRKKSDVVETPVALANEKSECSPGQEGEEPLDKKAKLEGVDEPIINGGEVEAEVVPQVKEATSGAKAFRRVQAEQWIGKQGAWDNSYEATFGNQGWGAKAQEVLGKVRGKDFRHEKTKKKRGSYRGGVINSDAVNSIKFESD